MAALAAIILLLLPNTISNCHSERSEEPSKPLGGRAHRR